MKKLEKIVLLIDADNTQLAKMEGVLQEVSLYGRIVVKRAYGNWKKAALKKWEDEIKRLAIKAEQQFDYVPGKNATDMALVIDAVKLLYTEIYDAFVIVASDSDYTPLAINLHESGVYVIGVGRKETPESFRNSCDEFIFLENISQKGQSDIQETVVKSPKKESSKTGDIELIHDLLKAAADKYQDDSGFVKISTAGAFLKRAKPDFDVRTYGFVKLPKLIEAYPDKYQMDSLPGKDKTTIIVYKCI